MIINAPRDVLRENIETLALARYFKDPRNNIMKGASTVIKYMHTVSYNGF